MIPSQLVSELPQVVVSQADREAAAAIKQRGIYDTDKITADMIRTGELDHSDMVQAFARHALTARSRGIEPWRAHLAELTAAANAVLTGISVHNALNPDAPARRDDISGPVISMLSEAATKSRNFMAASPLPASEDVEGRAQHLAKNIMARLRGCGIPAAHTSENQDEFEALSLTPLLVKALSPDSGRDIGGNGDG